jgi:hypothetical protein
MGIIFKECFKNMFFYMFKRKGGYFQLLADGRVKYKKIFPDKESG